MNLHKSSLISTLLMCFGLQSYHLTPAVNAAPLLASPLVRCKMHDAQGSYNVCLTGQAISSFGSSALWATRTRPMSRSYHSPQGVDFRKLYLGIRGGSSMWSSTSATSRSAVKPKRSTDKQSTRISFPTVEDVSVPDSTSQQDVGTSDRQETKEMIDAFLTRDSRNSFIARVYAVLTGQLLVTAMSVVGFAGKRDLAIWFLTKGRLLLYLCMIGSVSVCSVMSTSADARRKSPTKWYLLSLFTIFESLTVGIISAMFSAQTVLYSFLATSAATGGVALYTILQRNPHYDLSQWGAGLSSLLLVLCFAGLLRLFFGDFIPISNVMYSSLGAVLFSFYLAYHTRLIVGGKNNKYQMNEKDYVFGAMALYMDIINIFVQLLTIFGEDDRK